MSTALPYRLLLFITAVSTMLGLAWSCPAQVCNLKVVTDANPDYSDIGSMLHSITSNWKTDAEKCWAIWYWNKIGRRQTAPVIIHGRELTDPIRQYNDYGFTMCSTVSGMNCGIWGAAGYDVKFWDISQHTVAEVEYDGAYHMYDSSLSALYTICDGSRLAGVAEIGAEGACDASAGKKELGHIARYHCLTATSREGFLEGCDTIRSLSDEARCFKPSALKYRDYYNNWDLGHRYILNLREGEAYTRYYHRLDTSSQNAVLQAGKRADYKADPAYFVPSEANGQDPEAKNPRYSIRGNGRRIWRPVLTVAELAKNAYALDGVRAVTPAGIMPVAASKPGEAIFKLEGANVITSVNINAAFTRRTSQDVATVFVSTSNGLQWKEVWNAGDQTGEISAEIKLIQEVNGAYEVLVKVQLKGLAAAADAQLTSLDFETITMVNSKTQPRLKLGKNTICVGTGEQTGSIVFWPDLHGDHWKPLVVEQENAKIVDDPKPYLGSLVAVEAQREAWVVFRMDAPADITRITYGGRFRAAAPGAQVDLLHSFDGGKSWSKTWSLTDTTPPFDVIHYEKAEKIPPGTRSVLYKYLWNASKAGTDCSIYAVRMEANHKPAAGGFKPVEVTFTWNERQKDYSLVKRSHTQLVGKVPFTYMINVGGADHPVMDSLTANLQGAVPNARHGYSDGQEVGGKRLVDRWITYGKNLAEGRPYTVSVPCDSGWGSGDPDGKKLTDGIVGPPEADGTAYAATALWKQGKAPVITVDLGKAEKCAAFRVQTSGTPFWDAMKGEIKDKIEVLFSADGQDYKSAGYFNFDLRWKDQPVNHPFPDDEKFTGHNFTLTPEHPLTARYVRFAVTPARTLAISEVQVLDSIQDVPFDLRIALPDAQNRSDITRYNPKHTPALPRSEGRPPARLP